MSQSSFRQGLWTANPALVQLLGLCPLLAVSNSLINALALGLATALVLLITNLLVSLSRPLLLRELRIPLYVLIIATAVSAIEIGMHALLPELHRILGIFIPIITTNCLILARAESCAARVTPLPALRDALAMGSGFLMALVVVGGLRELIGNGSLLDGAELLFGPAAADWRLQLADSGFILALLPPGAFIVLGLLVAAKNAIDLRARDPGSAADSPARDPRQHQ